MPVLAEMGCALMNPYLEYLEIEDVSLCFQAMERHYMSSNPFHNAHHGAMVGHLVVAILKGMDIHPPDADMVALILAALGHDMGHPGRSNSFYVATNSRLALIHNDESVLENYHVFLINSVLRSSNSETNIMRKLPVSESEKVRKKIAYYILSTDVTRHFAFISASRLGRGNLADNPLLSTMALKAADMGHALSNWNIHYQWSIRAALELQQQVIFTKFFRSYHLREPMSLI